MVLSDFAEKLFAGRWVAGPEIGDAIRVSRSLNSLGIGTLLNYMGEELRDREAVEQNVQKYLELISEIEGEGLESEISIKPTQLGLTIGATLMERSYSRIMEEARKRDIFVWLDMESHTTVDSTISLYLRQRRRENAGICIQSYLRRSEADIKRIAERGGAVRLVKGAYKESSEIAFASRVETTQNFSKLMRILFERMDRFMIATHDGAMVEQARILSRKYRKKPEYAMLNGIRNDYAKRLVDEHESVWLYVPFGRAWIPYTYRRMREWENLKLVTRSLFQNQKLV